MKVYKLTGYVPDFCEQGLMTVADIYTTKELALQALDKFKSDTVKILSEETESMKNFSTDETRFYGDTRFIANFTINVMCDPKQKKHREMLMWYSGFNNTNLRESDVKFDIEFISYRVASVQVTAEELNL